MVSELQFAAIAAFLIWCLVSSLSGLPDAHQTESRLIWREHGPAGWSRWRQVHFGLAAADRRLLMQPEPVVDQTACASLLDTVLQQASSPDSDTLQFAIVRRAEGDQTTLVFVSDTKALTDASRVAVRAD
jgi:hypothetical protein